MKAHQIPGWLDGVKIREMNWPRDGYIIRHEISGGWFDEDGEYVSDGVIARLFIRDDWEVYEEPKRKKTVTMYRPILKNLCGGYHIEGQWSDRKDAFNQGHMQWDIKGWQEMSVEVDE